MVTVALSQDQVRLLEEQRVARLATVDESGNPHLVPICFAYSGGVLYTPIDEKPKRGGALELRRVRNIRAHPEVCLLVDRYDDDWSQLAWLQIRGTASLVTDGSERSRALAALRGRYPQYRAMNLEALPLIRITPTHVASWAAHPEPAG